MTVPSAAQRGLQWLEIPVGAAHRRCKSCGQRIWFVLSTRGKHVPVSCDVDGAFPPHGEESGNGVNHFQTCPLADTHRKAQ